MFIIIQLQRYCFNIVWYTTRCSVFSFNKCIKKSHIKMHMFIMTICVSSHLRQTFDLNYAIRKHLHDCNSSLLAQVEAPKTSSSPPRFMEVLVPSKDDSTSLIYVLLGIIFCLFIPYFNWILELFQHYICFPHFLSLVNISLSIWFELKVFLYTYNCHAL